MGLGEIIGGQGLGMILGDYYRSRQREQQEDLTKIQVEGQKEMGKFNKEQQLDLWNKTNAGAQVQHYKDAGLNVGLMYQGGGAGGATAAASSGSVGGGTAEAPSAGAAMGLQLASQLALQKAQKENIEADTANKKAGTENTGVQTEQGKVNLDTSRQIQTATVDKALEEARSAMAKAKMDVTNSIINEETYKDQIQQIKAEAAGEMLKNKLTEGNIKLTDRKIWQIAEQIAQGWKGIEFQGVDKVTGKYIEQVADFIKKLTVGSGGN
ncbi:MAG: DNA pilot protein [Malazfec virus 5]